MPPERSAGAAAGPGVPLFSFEGVGVDAPDGTALLAGVDLEVPDGGVTVVLGPSGAGKSTLLRLCNRLLVPSAGVVRFRGDDVAGLDPLVLRRRVGMVFQRPTLFPGTVADNCREADRDVDAARCAAVLDRCGLDDGFVERVADELSGGEAQRACIARTLLTSPEALLMDEPTASLDPENRHLIERLARDLASDGHPVVWVTHDLDQAERLADRVIVLVDGRVADPETAARFRQGAS